MPIYEQNNTKHIELEDDVRAVPSVEDGKLIIKILKPDNTVHTKIKFSKFYSARDFMHQLKEITGYD